MTMTSVTELDVSVELQDTLALQRAAYHADPVPTLAQRRDDLRRLAALVRDHKDALADAVNRDYGHRSRHETLFTEIVPTLDAAAHASRHLKRWMRPQRRPVDLKLFAGGRSRLIPQPLGVVGSIVPWNFPINLSFVGLVSIFAAGNRAMVKMSENSRHLTRLLIELSPAYFPRDKLAWFEETGGVGVAFSQLPFDHLMFTGSGATGRAVMAAAARNLCPVTLELGGKSPAILCDDYPLRKAAERLLFVKCINAGQICTTVDHVYLPRGRADAFVAEAKAIVTARYGGIDSPDYTSIIDERAFRRLLGALDEARAAGATLVPLLPGAPWDEATRKIAPHVVLGAPESSQLRQREIFGPILPLIEYDRLDDVIAAVNAGPRPLALYPFTGDARTVQTLLDRVMSGGVTVNDALYHVAQHDLPFGGVGGSGMGHYHGAEGFQTFSKLRPVFWQAPFSGMKFMWPPYRGLADRVLGFLTR